MTADIIRKYFPELSEEQQRQFDALDALYRDWNAKINVISRKDIDNLYEHHVLHSLAIAKIVNFRPGTEVLDFGTGGGFPGMALCQRGQRTDCRRHKKRAFRRCLHSLYTETGSGRYRLS